MFRTNDVMIQFYFEQIMPRRKPLAKEIKQIIEGEDRQQNQNPIQKLANIIVDALQKGINEFRKSQTIRKKLEKENTSTTGEEINWARETKKY